MSAEEQLKQEILSKYKSIRAFTTAINIPYSTLDSVFKRGITNAGVSTMIRVFDALDLDIESVQDNCLRHRQFNKNAPSLSDEALRLALAYDGQLDTWGRIQVRTAMEQALTRQSYLATEKSDVIRRSLAIQSIGILSGIDLERTEDILLTDKSSTRRTSYCIRAGESADCYWNRYDILLVEKSNDIASGEIGIFDISGKSYVRYSDGNYLYPVVVDDSTGAIRKENGTPLTEAIQCIGRVFNLLAPELVIEKQLIFPEGYKAPYPHKEVILK